MTKFINILAEKRNTHLSNSRNRIKDPITMKFDEVNGARKEGVVIPHLKMVSGTWILDSVYPSLEEITRLRNRNPVKHTWRAVNFVGVCSARKEGADESGINRRKKVFTQSKSLLFASFDLSSTKLKEAKKWNLEVRIEEENGHIYWGRVHKFIYFWWKKIFFWVNNLSILFWFWFLILV